MKQAMAGRHWVAVGYSDQEELANVDRKIKDGILFYVVIQWQGGDVSH